MHASLYIRIRKRTQIGYMILFITLLPFCFGFLRDILGLPDAVRCVMDLAWMFLLFVLIYFHHAIVYEHIRPLLWWCFAFVALSLILYAMNFQSPLYYLWAARNNFRFYPFFLAACVFLTEQDAEEYLKIFDVLFWINAAVSVVQYYVFGIEQDFLGGLFGTWIGVNGYTNIFFLIIVCKSLLYFLHYKESLTHCAAKCVTCLLIAAMAELKYFLAEFVVVALLAVLFTRFSWRNLLIIAGGLVGVMAGAALLLYFFPEFDNMMSIEGYYRVASSSKGYTHRGDLNRLTVIPMVNRWFLRSPQQQLFGLGLGNCETAGFDVLTTYFYKRYGALHYHWLSTAFMYLEMGYTGLLFLYGFFPLNFYLTHRRQKRPDANILYCQLGKLLSICAVMVLIYNASMRSEAAYMLYLFLAFPYMKPWKKAEQEKNSENP